MHISLYEIAVWLIVGLIGGTLAGLIVKGGKHGFGLPANLALGLARRRDRRAPVPPPRPLP